MKFLPFPVGLNGSSALVLYAFMFERRPLGVKHLTYITGCCDKSVSKALKRLKALGWVQQFSRYNGWWLTPQAIEFLNLTPVPADKDQAPQGQSVESPPLPPTAPAPAGRDASAVETTPSESKHPGSEAYELPVPAPEHPETCPDQGTYDLYAPASDRSEAPPVQEASISSPKKVPLPPKNESEPPNNSGRQFDCQNSSIQFSAIRPLKKEEEVKSLKTLKDLTSSSFLDSESRARNKNGRSKKSSKTTLPENFGPPATQGPPASRAHPGQQTSAPSRAQPPQGLPAPPGSHAPPASCPARPRTPRAPAKTLPGRYRHRKRPARDRPPKSARCQASGSNDSPAPLTLTLSPAGRGDKSACTGWRFALPTPRAPERAPEGSHPSPDMGRAPVQITVAEGEGSIPSTVYCLPSPSNRFSRFMGIFLDTFHHQIRTII